MQICLALEQREFIHLFIRRTSLNITFSLLLQHLKLAIIVWLAGELQLYGPAEAGHCVART